MSSNHSAVLRLGSWSGSFSLFDCRIRLVAPDVDCTADSVSLFESEVIQDLASCPQMSTVSEHYLLIQLLHD